LGTTIKAAERNKGRRGEVKEEGKWKKIENINNEKELK
jgi:hypothetical protein